MEKSEELGVAQGVKIVDPGPGDAISGIRVLEDRRKAREEVDLQKLVKQEENSETDETIESSTDTESENIDETENTDEE